MAKWRILVVDDDSDIRDLVRSSLEPTYEVVEARDGLDALEKLERAEPDFVVLDIMMPLMDGIQACESIRRNPRYRDVTVLFLSALASKEDIQKGYGAGANLYLTKPFDPPRLRRNIDLFFEKRTGAEPPRRRYSLEELTELEHRGPHAIAQATPPSFSGTPAAPVRSAAPQIKPRILVVDDEPGTCTLATSALHNEFEVFCASDGLDAIGKITTYQPDLILIDTMMPRMSGYQLCQSLRKNARFAHTPIILASAKHSQKDREYSLRIGGNYFLQKPYTAIEVLHAAREMVEHPDFRLHMKALTEENIRELESHHTRGTRQKEQERTHQHDVHELEDFVKRHARD
jgi:CheY-like chemotaxis protein